MRIFKLKTFIPIDRVEYRKRVLPRFGLLVAANFVFVYFFEFLHENFFMLGMLLVLNFAITLKLSILTSKRLLYFTKGNKRLWKVWLLAFMGEVFPPYNAYLIYRCMSAQEKKSYSATSLALKPLAVCFSLTLITLAISFPRAPKNLPLVLSPGFSYVSHVLLDSYRVFKLEDERTTECLNSDDWRCFQKATQTEVFPATNSGAVLAVSADAIFIFKKKEQTETNPAMKSSTKRLLKISRTLLETNSYFLKENSCHKRITPLNLSGPIHMMVGLQNAYILQIVDTLISKEFAGAAKARLIDIADSSIKKANELEDKETSRSIASIKEEILHDASNTCPPTIE